MQIRLFLLACLAGAAIAVGAETAQAAGQGGRCGGASEIGCDQGLWCEPQQGQGRGRHVRGRCVEVPSFCTMIYQPVCGRDGKTYSNDCVRRTSRIGKRHDGAC